MSRDKLVVLPDEPQVDHPQQDAAGQPLVEDVLADDHQKKVIRIGEPGFNDALMKALMRELPSFFAVSAHECAACGHHHAAGMGGICVGCPCEERP